VKTLAWVLKKPILPVSSLEVLARNLRDGSCPIVPFVDARKGKVYVRIQEDKLLLPGEAIQTIPTGACLIGDGVERYKTLLGQRSDLEIAPTESWFPRADELCRIASSRWPEGRGGASASPSRWPEGLVDDPHRLMPQYLYSKESDITGW
jgi:tRNA threonylcarbamoyladenosine biosynthesis protein TsaB